MEVYVSADDFREEGDYPEEGIESLFALQHRLGTCTDGAELATLQHAIERVWQETEESLVQDGEYWHRLNSTDIMDPYDDLDRLADDWEKCYYKEQGLVTRQRKGARREPKGEEGEGGVSASLPSSTAHYAPPPSRPPPVVASVLPRAPPKPPQVPFDPKKVLAIIDAYDSKLAKVTKNIDKGGVTIPSISSSAEIAALAAGYFDMMSTFRSTRYGSKYGLPSNFDNSPQLQFGENVPSYFANVGGETIFRRKELSIAGLANLVQFGPSIFSELRSTHFHGAPSAYSGDVGLNKMRRVTGNVVDLDTTVLRCNDAATLNVINMSNRHKKLPEFSNAAAFGSSEQAQEITLSCATRLLEDFSKQLGLTKVQQEKRSVALSQITTNPITVARDNSTRGHTPVWHYVNAGQNSFHVNVPTMDDVIGALLKAPFHCLRNYAFLKSGLLGAQEDQQRRFDDFFENCVVDSCFNMKWKAIEEYGEGLKHEGSTRWVLEQCQMRNQSEFTADLFDKDNEERDAEIALMWKLVQKEDLYGKDPDDGSIKKISEKDVATWVRST